MSEKLPPDVLTRLDEFVRWLDGGDGLLLGLDFDGTLSPIVDDPSASTLTPEARVVLEAFASEPSVAPVIVSGRGRDDLRSRVDVDGIAYAGNHGLELADGDIETVHPEAARKRPTIARICDELDDRLADVSGCVVENKGITATVHFRRVSADAVTGVVSTVDDVVSDVEGMHVTTGKQIREIRPSVDWDKGRVMERLSRTVPDGWRTVYVGDDRTDEDAFRAIQPDGVGIRVVDAADENHTTTTAARYRTRDHETVPHLLAWIGMCVGPRPLDARSDPLETALGFTDI